jgi:hypothetical protein
MMVVYLERLLASSKAIKSIDCTIRGFKALAADRGSTLQRRRRGTDWQGRWRPGPSGLRASFTSTRGCGGVFGIPDIWLLPGLRPFLLYATTAAGFREIGEPAVLGQVLSSIFRKIDLQSSEK